MNSSSLILKSSGSCRFVLTLGKPISDAFVLQGPPGTVSSKLLGFESQMIPFLFLFLFDYADGYTEKNTDFVSSVTVSVLLQPVYCLIVATLY